MKHHRRYHFSYGYVTNVGLDALCNWLWHHHWAEYQQSKLDMRVNMPRSSIICHLMAHYVMQDMNLCMYCRNKCDCVHSECYVGVYFLSYKATQGKNSKITASWVHQQLVTPVHALFLYAPSQWKMTLQSNVVSHWLGACTKWSSLFLMHYDGTQLN